MIEPPEGTEIDPVYTSPDPSVARKRWGDDSTIIDRRDDDPATAMRDIADQIPDPDIDRVADVTADMLENQTLDRVHLRSNGDHMDYDAATGVYENGKIRVDTSTPIKTSKVLAHELGHAIDYHGNVMTQGVGDDIGPQPISRSDVIGPARDHYESFPEPVRKRKTPPEKRNAHEVFASATAYQLLNPDAMRRKYPDVSRELEKLIEEKRGDDKKNGGDGINA